MLRHECGFVYGLPRSCLLSLPGDVLQIIGYGGIGGVLQCLLVNNLYSRRAFPKVACRTIRGHDERLFVADFVSEEVAVAVETIPEMHNDRVERI